MVTWTGRFGEFCQDCVAVRRVAVLFRGRGVLSAAILELRQLIRIGGGTRSLLRIDVYRQWPMMSLRTVTRVIVLDDF